MQSQYIPIGKAAKLIGVTPTTLRRWEKTGKIKPVRTPTNRRVYSKDEILSIVNRSISGAVMNWAANPSGEEPDKQHYCSNSAVFQYRLTRLGEEMKRANLPEERISLIVAVAGEIGNNSFDHNLGNWPDVPGVFFSYNLKEREIALADRGQGILKTLRQVRPKIKDEQRALKVAFTEIISGRAPEQRGNGLKFVRESVPVAKIELYFQTGGSFIKLNKENIKVTAKKAKRKIQGCLATIHY